MSDAATTNGAAHPWFARAWALAIGRFEPRELREQRSVLVEGLVGTVVEVGPGSGSTFPCYPPEVERVVAVEPEPYLRGVAEQAAAACEIAIDVVDGTADALPLADGTADAVVCSLVLCSVPDQAAALAEAA